MSDQHYQRVRLEERLDDMLAFHEDRKRATVVDTPAGKAFIIGGQAIFCQATDPRILQWMLDAIRDVSDARIAHARRMIGAAEGSLPQ